jgi:PAS domain S-box-containing protein
MQVPASQFYQIIAQHTRDFIGVHDIDGTFLHVTPSVKEVVGYEPNEMIGKNPYQFFHPDDMERIYEEAHRNSLSGKLDNQIKYRFRCKTGEYVWLDTTSRLVEEKGAQYLVTSSRNISQQVHLEELLEESQQMARLGSWEYDVESNIITWTKETYRIHEETFDKTIRVEDAMYYYLPERRAEIQRCVKEAVKGGKPYDIETQIRTARGNIIWVRSIGKAYQVNGKTIKLYGTFQNIDQQKKAELILEKKQNEVAKGRKELLEVLNSLGEGVIVAKNVLDSSGNIQDYKLRLFNDKATHLSDVSINVKEGGSVSGIIPANLYTQVLPLFITASLQQRSIEKQVLHQGNMDTWYKVLVVPYDNGIIATFSDISYLKQTEVVLREQAELLYLTNKELTTAKQQAESAAMAKAQFLSTMSHEIRTPMNAVLGLTQLLLEEEPREDQLDHLETLKFSTDNLLVIINDILDFNKIESGKIEIESVSLSLHELARAIKQSLLARANEKGIWLKVNIDENIPVHLVGDPVRLTQVLTNLLSNAVKFTEQGGVELRIDLQNSEEDTLNLHFQVIDTGIGIPEDKINTVFDQFSQAGIDTTRKYGGTGLGLAICLRLLEMMGSCIELDSTPGKGSNFHFVLPMKKVNNSKLAYPDVTEEKQHREQDLSAFRATVLVVDDNRVNQKVVGHFLNKWGVKVAFANHGGEATEKIQSFAYNLVLMDLQMPEMNGYEASHFIRSLPDPYYQQVPIIALSADVVADVNKKVIAAGMNDYATKPFNPEELYTKLNTHLEVQRSVPVE